MHKLKTLSPEVKRYLVIGVSVYLFELAIIVTAQTLGASAVLAVSLSFWLGLITSFGLQKFFAFGDKRTQRQVLVPQVLAFSLLVLFNYGFTVLVVKLLVHKAPVVVGRTLALGLTTLWNFYLYKKRIFKVPGAILLD